MPNAVINKMIKVHRYSVGLCVTEVVRRLPWLYTFFPPKLRSANINITDRCCFRCVMCNQWNGPTKKELTTGEWKEVICQLKGLGVRRINISGGEPLLRQDIGELVRYAASLGMGVTLLTNGYLLDAARLGSFIDSGLESISVSLDGIGSDFERVRGIPGAYDKVEQACRFMAREAKKGLITASISFVLMKETVDHLKGILEMRRSLGLPLTVNLADFTPYFFVGRKKEQFWIDDPAIIADVQKMLLDEKAKEPGSIISMYSEIDFIRRYFADPLQKQIPCAVSQERICIDPEGSVFGGCWSMGTFGNVRENSLGSMVRSQKYLEAHKRMFFKKCPGCSCGYAVNLRNHSSSAVREAAYRIFPSMRKRISS